MSAWILYTNNTDTTRTLYDSYNECKNDFTSQFSTSFQSCEFCDYGHGLEASGSD